MGEKTKQLEETLAAARNDTSDLATAKKKSKTKKKNTSPNEDPSSSLTKAMSKSTSLTRERRLQGGLVISDIILGQGAPVKPGKKITIHYVGSLKSNGHVFDKNHSKQHP